MSRWCVVAVILVGLTPLTASYGATVTVTGFDSAGVAAAVAASQAGDTIQLAAGAYALTEPIKLKSKTKLLGAGQGQTVLRCALPQAGNLIDLAGVEEIEIAGLALDGENDPKVQQGLFAYNSRRLHLHDLAFRNMLFGVHFNGNAPTREHGVTDSVIADCTFEDMGVGNQWGGGVRFSWGSSRNLIERCAVRNAGRGGLFGDNGSNDLVIRHNTVSGSGGEGLGIEVWGDCDRAVIEDNHIDHWLSIGGCDGCAVRRNTVSDKSGSVKFLGIEVIGSLCVITDNVVDDGQQIGISVSSTQPKEYVLYAYNTVRNCIEWDAQFQGEAGGIAYQYFYRCRFDETSVGRGQPIYPNDGGHGFRTNGNVKHCVFEECGFDNNGRSGLQLGGDGVDFLSFLRCTISGNKGPACLGPGSYSAPVAQTDQTVEWVGVTAKGNGSDALPAGKPFSHAAPTAGFKVSGRLTAGVPVSFVSEARAAAGGIGKTLWDFGDGVPVMGDRASHAYPEAGRYRVTQVVWDESGRAARAEKTLEVAAAIGPLTNE